jgi:hypothetical protein
MAQHRTIAPTPTHVRAQDDPQPEPLAEPDPGPDAEPGLEPESLPGLEPEPAPGHRPGPWTWRMAWRYATEPINTPCPPWTVGVNVIPRVVIPTLAKRRRR